MKRIVVKVDELMGGIWTAEWEDGDEIHRSGDEMEAWEHARESAREHGAEAVLISRAGEVALRADFRRQ